MRLDRIITVSLARRGVLRNSNASPYRLPILMYHSISEPQSRARSGYHETATRPEVFARHMEIIASLGYVGTTMTEAWRSAISARTGDQSAPRVVAITFDDGFRDFRTAAFPILQQHGFSATMYLATHFVGSTPRVFLEKECLTWSEVADLHDAGVEFGSHTVNHPKLVGLEWPEIADELRSSKAAIEDHLSAPVASFAYPFSFPQGHTAFVRRFQGLLAEIGYDTSVTTAIGRAAPAPGSHLLPRLPANTLDDPEFFAAKLAGYYDWMRIPQRAWKFLQKWLP